MTTTTKNELKELAKDLNTTVVSLTEALVRWALDHDDLEFEELEVVAAKPRGRKPGQKNSPKESVEVVSDQDDFVDDEDEELDREVG